MANMSIRGLDAKTYSRLKQLARREGTSLNTFVVRMLQGEGSASERATRTAVFDDLDSLAGTWSTQEAKSFARHTAAFSEVDPALWK